MHQLKAQMWEGLRQYVIGGWNTGRDPLRTNSCSSITRWRRITPWARPGDSASGLPGRRFWPEELHRPLRFTTDQTDLGTLVSVALVRSIDIGGERFAHRPNRAHQLTGTIGLSPGTKVRGEFNDISRFDYGQRLRNWS